MHRYEPWALPNASEPSIPLKALACHRHDFIRILVTDAVLVHEKILNVQPVLYHTAVSMLPRQSAPQLKSFTTNDSVNIVYRQEGAAGPVVILLHGELPFW